MEGDFAQTALLILRPPEATGGHINTVPCAFRGTSGTVGFPDEARAY